MLNIFFYYYYCGAKEFDNPGPLYTKPKAHTEEEEMAEDNKESPNSLETLPRTIWFSTILDPRREERHAVKGSLLECLKKKDKYSKTSMGAWCRSNSKRNCHLCIKCPQLTFWPH